jgi:hypothetical protein
MWVALNYGPKLEGLLLQSTKLCEVHDQGGNGVSKGQDSKFAGGSEGSQKNSRKLVATYPNWGLKQVALKLKYL